ncbi:MAG: hypothetical protein IJ880_03600 [Bacilli bacterium]|nr:hypothetical protein [Bacilli bacterium]MBR3119772.1 hypothetical protein [Oceanobacillus sp.]
MSIPNFKFPTEVDFEKMERDEYAAAKNNKENMSYWLPKIETSNTRNKSSLKIPKTKTEKLDFNTIQWLRSDSYSKEAIQEFNNLLISKLGDFESGKTIFMKTGVFSNKFNFKDAIVHDRNNIGQQFLDIFYTSMCLGVPLIDEVVFRELIEDKEDRPKIYSGMPLHTEYRVFFDFDTNNVLGVSNYWHPEEMERYLSDNDKGVYLAHKDILLEEFNGLKDDVALEVAIWMNGVDTLEGKWSVDVMKNGNKIWIIDMARMQRSALVNRMEPVTIPEGYIMSNEE